MLINIITWIIIFFTLFSFGDMILVLFNKLCRRSEDYNPVDKILLGLSFVIIPLSIWSLWLPSNQFFLLICFLVSFNYWVFSYKRLLSIFSELKKELRESLSVAEIGLLLLFVLSSLYFFTWQQDVYDSAFYHMQNIRWNEEYAVVPGLANLDDRFGFNSNYFLLSAIFTFRFLLGEAIYPLQPLIVTLIGCWVLYELISSRYEMKRVVLLLSYMLLFWVSIYFLGNTSTDILPNFIAFYLFANIVLYPKNIKARYLLGMVLPVFLLTCKLSVFPIGLISLYLLYWLCKTKQYKVVSFAATMTLLILIPWLIRNVVVSGYLLYPFYQFDFFSFDWKVPIDVAIKEKAYIFDVGYYFFRVALRYPHQSVRDPLFINIITDVIFLLTLISYVLVFYIYIKKRKILSQSIYLLYVIYLLSSFVWIFGGPDVRFIAGTLCAVIFTGGILFIQCRKKEIYYLSSTLGKGLILIFAISLLVWTYSCYYTFSVQTKETIADLHSKAFFKPFSIKEQQRIKDFDQSENFIIYEINNDQYIRVIEGLPYDMALPTSIASHYAKFCPLECIEARGYSIDEGYRVREGCE